jgi:hypothetical protein
MTVDAVETTTGAGGGGGLTGACRAVERARAIKVVVNMGAPLHGSGLVRLIVR